jgi:hypothetical protein
MPLIILTVIVQTCFIFHVFKTGRPFWWAYVILGFPVVGCVIYYFLEVFPGSREHRVANRATRELGRALNPDKELRRCREAVEISPTVENRVALAEELLRHERTQDAIDLYRAARSGPYANDPQLTFGLANACLAHRELAEARKLLEDLAANYASFRADAVALLRARVLEALGEHEAALTQYERVAESCVGLETRVRYGQLLKKLGYLTQAQSVLQEVVIHARRFRIAHEEERAWADIAQRELTTPQQ